MLSYATLSILCYWRDEDRALGNHLEMMTPLLLTVFDATEQKKSQGHTVQTTETLGTVSSTITEGH